MIIPVILSGGVGSRLWPLSREAHPKQFMSLMGDNSMIAEATLRARSIACVDQAPIVVCNEAHRFMVAEQLRQVEQSPQSIILEPVGRNTAPAVAVAALRAEQLHPDAVLLVMPADHVVQDVGAFSEAVERGLPQAEGGSLVTFGIVPDGPETGYGYIQKGEPCGQDVFQISQFVEKPDIETAKEYLASGDYFWNSGIFLLKARSYLEILEKEQPEMSQCCCKAMLDAVNDLDFTRLNTEAFESSPSDSIDYAVMEKIDCGVVVPVECGWSDVGAWSTLWDIGNKDSDGNVHQGDVLLEDASNSYIRSESRLVTAVGVKDLVVVETADVVMVADRKKAQDVKQIVNRLKSAGREEAKLHKRVLRPWGAYESLVVGERFQVKRITVVPGASLSLQMHHHRAEHWIVVSGTAEVVRGDEVVTLTEDQSTYIPLGIKHRLSNPGVIPLELIEVQTGSYLGEDDIVRFEDVYGR